MATQELTHPNPKVQKVLAFARLQEAAGNMPSAAELCRRAAEKYRDPSLATVNVGRQVRQVFRDVGRGCGRGNTYGKTEGGKVAKGLTAARKAQLKQAQQTKAKTPKADKAPAKPKATRKPRAKKAQQAETASA